jgi:WD40 repeat protein
VAAGDSGGNVHKLDLRKNLKSIGKFQGNAGSIRGISIHESAPYLAAVGLDRYVRIFDTNSRKLVASVGFDSFFSASHSFSHI